MKRKEFKVKVGDEEVALYFKTPTHAEVMAIDMEHRKIYSMAIRNGILTHAEAIKQHTKNGAWNKEDESEVADLMFKVALLEEVIKSEEKTIEEKREAALKAAKIRAELLQKMGTKTGLFDYTAESMADQQKVHKFIQLCTYIDAEDQRLFDNEDSYQTFLNENEVAGSELYREAYFFANDLPDDISEGWAEVQFLKEDAEASAKKTEEAKKSKKKTAKKKTSKKTATKS